MNKGIYTKCDLLCIQDDFNIQDNLSVKDSIIDCDKKTLSSIIVSSISNKMCEVLTGVEFDYSDINVHCYYSKFLNKGVTKRRIKHSSEPIHVSLYSETFSDLGFSNMNYKYVDDLCDVQNNAVINKVGIWSTNREVGYCKNHKKSYMDNVDYLFVIKNLLSIVLLILGLCLFIIIVTKRRKGDHHGYKKNRKSRF